MIDWESGAARLGLFAKVLPRAIGSSRAAGRGDPATGVPPADCGPRMVGETAVDELGVFSPALWDETTQAEALLRLSRLQTKVTATKLRLMAGADRVAAAEGHRSIAAWLTRHTRARDTGLRREHRLATALDTK